MAPGRRCPRGDGDLHAVAGGEDQASGDAFARFQIGQRGGERFLAEGETFAHLDGAVCDSRR